MSQRAILLALSQDPGEGTHPALQWHNRDAHCKFLLIDLFCLLAQLISTTTLPLSLTTPLNYDNLSCRWTRHVRHPDPNSFRCARMAEGKAGPTVKQYKGHGAWGVRSFARSCAIVRSLVRPNRIYISRFPAR